MNKAILVIDMPDSCNGCPLCYGNNISDWCLPVGNHTGDVFKHVTEGTKPDWCPLKPVPRMKFTYIDRDSPGVVNYNQGWNDCLNKIQ